MNIWTFFLEPKIPRAAAFRKPSANLLSWAEVSCSHAGTGCVVSHSECGKTGCVYQQAALCLSWHSVFSVFSSSACVCRGVGGRSVWPWRRGCLQTAHALIAAAACLCSSANAAEDCTSTSWGWVVSEKEKTHRYPLWLECKVPLLWQVQNQIYLNDPEPDSHEYRWMQASGMNVFIYMQMCGIFYFFSAVTCLSLTVCCKYLEL